MFIRTEEGNKINYTQYRHPYVEPLSSDEWHLCINISDNNSDNDKIRVIASFSKVSQANEALDSLKEAMERSHGWDAKDYKESRKLFSQKSNLTAP